MGSGGIVRGTERDDEVRVGVVHSARTEPSVIPRRYEMSGINDDVNQAYKM